jgi:predicted dehydrogenase
MNQNVSNKNTKLRVAILGASGIGKNHAAWFVKNHCEVVAFAGSAPEKVNATRDVLQSRLGYAPHGYTDVSQLLQSEKLDAVCISTPPALHFEQAQLCLQNGVHTLCEKPLVYDPQLPSEVLIAQAWDLVDLAEARETLLGTQMQYAFAATKMCEMAQVSPNEIETFDMEMETKNLKPGRSHETIWIELAPHPLSVLQRVAPGAQLDESSIKCKIGDQETDAHFRVQRENGAPIEARLTVRCNPETTSPLRRFTLNGRAVDCSGRKNASGDFLTYISDGETEIEMPDLVDLLIGNFVAACKENEPLMVTGQDGAQNVAWMLKILERGNRI